ncbi:MAG: alanine--tRNA ligase [Candidatus Nanopelagicales bacterium]|nr:alanine--tRNA ligase [Candidatus Nanopelagicales bacterium]
MDSADIRRRFLDFFEKNGHTIVPSASLIANDPTLLLVNAGMVPFKPYFLGEAPAPYKRATSVQKCVRTLDIEEVGKTTRHGSFFQMAGNFSFGDYFKEGAITMAWKLLTSSVKDGGYGFDPEKLWVTIYLDDEEAYDIWRNKVGVPENKIQRRGMADNYWSMGIPGPCGPCSEIYFDRGPEHGKEGGPIADEERYLEVWNLVFMQYNRGEGGTKDDFPLNGELPAKNIDTGMGLERMAAILQGVDNIYEIDTTKIILDKATAIVGVKYGAEISADIRLRVVADHTRTAAFLIGDGVIPGNEGRGYVLRRMMRRVIRNMRILGADNPVMKELIETTIKAMGPQYPELVSDKKRILEIAIGEETSFAQTLKTGTMLFENTIDDLTTSKSKTLSGEKVFELHDTYGFPYDLTLEMATEAGISIDAEGFKRLMLEQKNRAKADAKERKQGLADVQQYRALADLAGITNFTGYSETSSEVNLKGLLVNGAVAKSVSQGSEVEFVLDRSPFYAEGGGQLADSGKLVLSNGSEIEVDDVQQPVPGLYVHRGRVAKGEAVTGLKGVGHVDLLRRKAISRAHTATHLIHKAFREALGETATQLGSENSPGRLRFDFPSPKPVPLSVLNDVEARVNEVLLNDLGVSAQLMSQDQARSLGAMALFGEKYGDVVRVVSVGDWAHELCGGTHAQRSAQLGVIKFLGEQSIGAGTRRVEALVGTDAYQFLAREHLIVSNLQEMLKGRPEELADKVSSLMERLKDAEKEIEKSRKNQLSGSINDYLKSAHEVNGVKVANFLAEGELSANDVRELVTNVRGQLGESAAVVIGAGISGGKVNVVVATNDAARKNNLNAGEILNAVLSKLDGKGGGKADMAQGAGSNVSDAKKVIAGVDSLIR